MFNYFLIQVDWALLAQQWIRMKEVHETVITNVSGPVTGQHHLPMEPISSLPPQPITGFCFNTSSVAGGEAPMDVEKDESEGSKDAQSGTLHFISSMGKFTDVILMHRFYLLELAPRCTIQLVIKSCFFSIKT